MKLKLASLKLSLFSVLSDVSECKKKTKKIQKKKRKMKNAKKKKENKLDRMNGRHTVKEEPFISKTKLKTITVYVVKCK